MQGGTGLLNSQGLPLPRASKSFTMAELPRSNGINALIHVLWVTGKCRGLPGTVYGCTGSKARAPGAQAGLSYPACMVVPWYLNISP